MKCQADLEIRSKAAGWGRRCILASNGDGGAWIECRG